MLDDLSRCYVLLAQAIVSSGDLVVSAGERAAAGAAEAVTAAAGGASLTDNVTTLLFFAAVAALSSITLGVRDLPRLEAEAAVLKETPC